MRFESRELKDYAEPVPADRLEENVVYFTVRYVDEQMLVPELEPIVFVGKNLRSDDAGLLYFQDIDSYREGSRFNAPRKDSPGTFICVEEADVSVYDFEHALDLLLECSLRRRALGLQ